MTTIDRMIEGLRTGQCLDTFNKIMTRSAQENTILKTAGVALLSGIFARIVIGRFSGVAVAAIVGIAAFAYFTTSYTPAEAIANFVRDGLNNFLS